MVNGARLRFQLFMIALLGAWTLHGSVRADVRDPFDPFDRGETTEEGAPPEDSDQAKTADELINEAVALQRDERFLDARTKLLRALEKNPKAFQAHLLLAEYYLREVGHFRLALRYLKQAQGLFEEKHGPPPYRFKYAQLIHQDVLSLLSDIRLNLDNYQGALDAADLYQSYGYSSSWLQPHRAWILMKLGRLQEAITTARLGMLAGAEPGHTLNVLGILLSMTEQKQASLDILKQAAVYEMSLGKEGRPATPLNNAGEVYKEIFQEKHARDSWLQATSLPDGCEHVLPSLNLSMLCMEQNNFKDAKRALDNFESCMAQFPLKNGEEHRALVHMARGRIALHSGAVDAALEHLAAAMENRQWFGKIGTSQKGLRAAVMNSHLRLYRPATTLQGVGITKERLFNRVQAWWLMRRARQLLAEDLHDFEDIYVRHTDSMLEYPTLGTLLAGYPQSLLETRLSKEAAADHRERAAIYYKAYRAEGLAANGARADARKLLDEVLFEARPTHDDALRTHAQLLKLGLSRPDQKEYAEVAYEVFRSARPELRNFSFRLPVNFAAMDRSVERELNKSAFLLSNSREFPCVIHHGREGSLHVLGLSCEGGPIGNLKAKSADLKTAVNNFVNATFTQEP
jgi:tetratricopeptide (TPR) repeat protein